MISVVIPAYNEEGAIADTVERVRAILAGMERGGEVIVVDDGSLDDTAALAEKAGAVLVRKPHNVGYGHSLKLGIKAATHDTIVIVDADGTYPIETIPAMIERYRQGFDLVVAARTGPHYRESALKQPLRQLLKFLVEFTAGRTIPDVNSGLRVFSKATVTSYFPHLSNGFSFTTSQTLAYMLCSKYVNYMPADYHKRVGGTKVRLFRDSLRTLQYIVQAILFYNPLKLFLVLCALTGLPSLLLLALSAGFDGETGVLIGFLGLMTTVLIFCFGLLGELLRQFLVVSKNE
ncbi:family 2 glycosyl transferase [Paramagnetospirillum caucaseum]|uniref:Family 2 glycosyl transferase n=1 Tax=Paramagnetospirillum caucaseum TaxID=1244869 RepID=M3A9Y4_9PROT|nr:glycosyltransferase family 2 protein [Paramagnetospirillum caucaseum]EME69319.1 family 2 glycosyl transferase [Paramagnetospirillum caucaseum]